MEIHVMLPIEVGAVVASRSMMVRVSSSSLRNAVKAPRRTGVVG
jgi:acyl-CoA hydrolase